MNMLLVVIVLLLLFGLGGGYYGHRRWGPSRLRKNGPETGYH